MESRPNSSSLCLPPPDAAAAAFKESIAAVLRWLKLATAKGEDDAENVHQLRIAIRRATAALELFQDFLPRGCTRQLLRQLKKLRKVTGSIRDSDVLADLITHDTLGIATYGVSGQLAKRRVEARAELLRLYEEWGRGEYLERLATEALCGIRPRRQQRKRSEETFSSFARRQLRAARREFRRRARTKLKRRKKMHEFRIEVKGLRYRLELLRPAFREERYESVYGRIKQITQQLGEINDHAMAEATLQRWRKEFPQSATLKLLKQAAARERKAYRRSLADFSDWWSRGRPQKLCRKLKKLASARAASPSATNHSSATPRMRPAK